MTRPPPISTLFPTPPLSRSRLIPPERPRPSSRTRRQIFALSRSDSRARGRAWLGTDSPPCVDASMAPTHNQKLRRASDLGFITQPLQPQIPLGARPDAQNRPLNAT